MNDIIDIIRFVGDNIASVWPLFLASIVLSVLIRALKLDGMIRRVFDTHIGLSILLATLVGAFSPFCSCTVIPVIAGLLISGVPLAPIMSFWIASPTMDPEILTLSIGILGWPLALARLAATLAVSLAAGYITWALGKTPLLAGISPTDSGRKARPGNQTAAMVPLTAIAVAAPGAVFIPSAGTGSLLASSCETGSCGSTLSTAASCGTVTGTLPPSSGWRAQLLGSLRAIDSGSFLRDVLVQSWQLGRWMVLAFVMEALITQYVPQKAIAGMLGEGNLFAIPLAALIGVPLYLNNFSALPIVSGLLANGMLPGAAIAFLIAGPVTTIPAMTAVFGTVNKRIFTLYLSVSLVGAVIMGFLTNLVLT